MELAGARINANERSSGEEERRGSAQTKALHNGEPSPGGPGARSPSPAGPSPPSPRSAAFFPEGEGPGGTDF